VVPQDVINALRGVRSAQMRARRGAVAPARASLAHGGPPRARLRALEEDAPADAEALDSAGRPESAPDARRLVALYDRNLRGTVLAGATACLPLERIDALKRPLRGALTGQPGDADWTDAATGRSYRFQVMPRRDLTGALTGATVVGWEVTGELQRERDLRRLANIVEQSDDAIIFKSLDGTITHWNRGAERLYGYRSEEAIGRPISMLAPGDRPDDPRALLSAAIAGGVVKQYETARRRKDGTLVEVSITLSPIHDADGVITGTSVIARDITAQRAAEDSLRATRERFQGAFDAAPIGMALLGLDGAIEQANEALAGICRRPLEELIGLSFADLTEPGDRQRAEEGLGGLIGEAVDELVLELRFSRGQGAVSEVSVHATLARESEQGPANVLCQVQDITQRKLFESQLRFMADHDSLTGLLNRRRFEAELERHIAAVKRHGPQGALLLLDLDQFKQVNDTLGHHAGDRLLVAVARVLGEGVRPGDILARLGGDEFALLLPQADTREATHVAQAIIRVLQLQPVVLAGESRRVTASIGIAMFDAAAEVSAESALVQADVAMYDAKESGRNGYSIYRAAHTEGSGHASWISWTQKIDSALERGRLALAAQPIIDLRTGSVWRHELLLRMIGEQGELIEPAAFLDIAERFQLITRLDEWVALRGIELLEQRPELRLSVNISGHSLGDERLMGTLTERLGGGTVEPGRLTFEVTETAAVAHMSSARAFAARLRALGCQMALDDFGAGFGSFYYLKHLPFDYVKIDGEFVQHVGSGRVDQLIIESVVSLARGLGCKTIAEFVTSASTERMVQELGVDYAQGFYLGEPVSLSEAFGIEPSAIGAG
jgi:diguanylate cyclase (GGDEF)-like protein/PAS domain S-box-containing protein